MKKNFALDRLAVILFGLLSFGFGICVLLLPGEEWSEVENRPLATLSAPTLSEVLDGSYATQISDFYSDRFPIRHGFTRLKFGVEMALGRLENNGVIVGSGGYLIPRGDYEELDVAQRNIGLISEIESLSQESGVPFACAIAPRSIDVLRAYLPDIYAGREGEIWEMLDSGEIEYIDLGSALREAAMRGDRVWYRTDHHWTSYGAYLAYRSLADALLYEPYPTEYFSVGTVSSDFLGTSYSTVGGVSFARDSVELYRYRGDSDILVKDHESGEETRGFYRLEELEKKDKYRVFLGGNYAHLSVTAPSDEPRDRLLLIKDSYANSIIPFLALHYDIEVIDLRYFVGSVEELVRSADRILFLHGADTLATTRLK